MLQPGDPAPAFELPDQDGESVSLSNYEGQRVVVYFYPRADTPGCTTEASGFRDRWADFAASDIAILGISDDPVDDLVTFKEKYELPFPLLSDESGEVASKYGSYGEKKMFGNTFDGMFRNTFVVGPEGVIEHVFENVSPDGHADEILAAIE